MKKSRIHPLKIFFSIIVITLFLSCGCSINKSDIKIPLSEPLPHPLLQKMQSIIPAEKDGEIIFNGSKKYVKTGIPILFLKGSPYEMGYARGILLKNQIRQWTIDCTYMIKRMGVGNIGLNLAHSRTKEIEPFIPLVYKDELKGLSAGCGIEYQTILMVNVLDTIGKQFACTSVAIKDKKGQMLRSRSLDFKDLEFLKPSILTIYKPDHGNAFASVGPVGNISVFTAINEKGLTFGVHDIAGSNTGWKGIPAGLLYRKIIQNADTVDDAENILKETSRCLPQMAMVSDLSQAAIFEFNKQIIDATIDLAVAYKPNLAFYESMGSKGWASLEKTIKYLNTFGDQVFTIADAKRGDIGNTSKKYAEAFFVNMGFDSITLAPYMGEDSITPFLNYPDKWAIVLALTSNVIMKNDVSICIIKRFWINRFQC